MLFGFKTNKNWGVLVLAIVMAAPLFVRAEAQKLAEADLAQARDAFNEVFQATEETTKRRDALQENLAAFDEKVAKAKEELEHASKEKVSVQSRIAEKERFVATLREQLAAVAELRAFYRSVGDTQAESFVRFARYVASKDIAGSDTGPAIGGSVVRRFLGESLGESIDEQIALHALLKARKHMAARIDVLLVQSRETETRLVSVADSYDQELASLRKDGDSLDETVHAAAAVIDLSWKEKKLTEAELQEVAAETAESYQRLSEIQDSLVKINEELKMRKLGGLEQEMQSLAETQKALEKSRDALELKDAAMRLLQDEELRAYQQGVKNRNTDKKLYKRIELVTLTLHNLEESLSLGVVDLGGINNETRPMTENENASLRADIERAKAELALMKEGFPEEDAKKYLDAKKRAADAATIREAITLELADIKPKLLQTIAAMSALAVTIEKGEREYDLGFLPDQFTWPVRGPITATYADPEYVKVFGVPHRAIDIAVTQGSVVHSIADGVVFAVRDGGATGYSYILIGHSSGYASLYGHISSFLVSKGDIVKRGQPIALSGGIPGTHGAGPMTTGAHVHLEVTKDGQHINPQSILK